MPAYKQSHDVNKIYSHLEQAHKIIQEMKCAYDVRLGEREPQWLRDLECDIETALDNASVTLDALNEQGE